MTSESVSTLAATRDVFGWCVLHGATIRVMAFLPDGAPQIAIQPVGLLPAELRRLLMMPHVRTRVAQYLAAGTARFCAGAPDAHSHSATAAGFAHLSLCLLTFDQREHWEEPAAVREIDAGMIRSQAELLALFDVLESAAVIESVVALSAAA